MDTQDLQLFRSGSHVRIRPVRVMAMFDGRPDSPALSDHDGFRVIYELSWRVDGAAEEGDALGADAAPPLVRDATGRTA